ncbi:MAG: hypothetical protein ABSG25_05045 [Bryobacteraceae bacterium]
MKHIPVQFLRIILAALAICFAHVLGRAIVRLRRYRLPYSRALAWILRTAVCLFGVLWKRPFDPTSLVTLALAALGFVLGLFIERRPPQPVDVHQLDNQ